MLTTYVRTQRITLVVIGLMLCTGFSFWQPGVTQSATTGVSERTVLLPDDRLVRGTVQDVKSGQIQVNIGELMPVFLSVEAASEKGMRPLKSGDKLQIVVTDENELIDFHLADQPGWDRVVKGHLAQPVVGDQRWAVIRTPQGRLEPYEVAEGNDARQKVLQLPVGVPALFLLNKANLIIDATFGNERALMQTLAKWSKDRQRIVDR
ncbi:MAG: hypothetical protein ABI980_15155 [Nitrospirota bacterium]